MPDIELRLSIRFNRPILWKINQPFPEELSDLHGTSLRLISIDDKEETSPFPFFFFFLAEVVRPTHLL